MTAKAAKAAKAADATAAVRREDVRNAAAVEELPFTVLGNKDDVRTQKLDMRSLDQQNRQMLNYALGDAIGSHAAGAYAGVYPLAMLAPIGTQIESYISDNYIVERHDCMWLNALLNKVENYIAVVSVHIKERLDRSRVEFDDIPLFLTPGTEVVSVMDGEAIGGKLHSVKRVRTYMGAVYYEIDMDVVHCINRVPSVGRWSTSISLFQGVVDPVSLPVRAVTQAEKVALTARGRVFRKCVEPTLMQYSGQLSRTSWWGTKNYRADGRVMVDPASLKQVDHDQFTQEARNSGIGNKPDDDNRAPHEITDADLWRTFPFVYGFSLRAKQWGRIAVSGMSDVQWRDEAFDKLVLDPETKHIVRSLVEHSGGTFDDLIDGKGGGCIFLMHGPPGEGKTLTAEAIAELLHRPLYAISVGELGVTPDELEERLRMILDIATVWDAVVLLDEADIYLEARDERDIVRNAMVGVFLRLLEYHQGVLFLTTNRVRNIDSAFYSRISVGINYARGDAKKRAKIWTNLLSAARIEGIDVNALVDNDLNGRQIKTAIRLAQTMARAEDSHVDTDAMRRVINFVQLFEKQQKKKQKKEK